MKQGIVFTTLIFICTTPLSVSWVHAEPTNALLTIKPQKCVALRQGSVCYQDLKINWHASASDNYCLFIKDNNKPLQCWHDAITGKTRIEFESNKSLTYIIKKQNEKEALSNATVEVKWVYRKKRELSKGWRMF